MSSATKAAETTARCALIARALSASWTTTSASLRTRACPAKAIAASHARVCRSRNPGDESSPSTNNSVGGNDVRSSRCLQTPKVNNRNKWPPVIIITTRQYTITRLSPRAGVKWSKLSRGRYITFASFRRRNRYDRGNDASFITLSGGINQREIYAGGTHTHDTPSTYCVTSLLTRAQLRTVR